MTLKEKFEPEYEGEIKELKKRFVKDMKPSMLANDELFYKFLKAREFDLEQAELMLRKHLVWRKEYRVDDVLTEINIIPEELQKYCPYSLLGFDKDGSPVYYIDFGGFDIKGFRKTAKFYDRSRYLFKLTEEEDLALVKQSKKLGNTVRGVVYILNMQNFSFATASDKNVIEETIKVIRFYQDNYPEHLKSIYIINASTYFTLGFAVCKKFMVASIIYKLKIMGNEEEWKPVLLKALDAETLPAFLGGSRTDPDGDPMCKSFVRHGAPIPPKYFRSQNSSSLAKSKDVKKLVIPRSTFSEIELQVKESGSFIEWEFETKSRDVGFGLFFKEKDADNQEKITELVPLLRLDSEDNLENGTLKCDKPGTYVILFDNSYSWLRAKELFYRARVISPMEHERRHEEN